MFVQGDPIRPDEVYVELAVRVHWAYTLDSWFVYLYLIELFSALYMQTPLIINLFPEALRLRLMYSTG